MSCSTVRNESVAQKEPPPPPLPGPVWKEVLQYRTGDQISLPPVETVSDGIYEHRIWGAVVAYFFLHQGMTLNRPLHNPGNML